MDDATVARLAKALRGRVKALAEVYAELDALPEPDRARIKARIEELVLGPALTEADEERSM